MAGYRATKQRPSETPPEPHKDSARRREKVGKDSNKVGSQHGTSGAVRQNTASDTHASDARAERVVTPAAGRSMERSAARARGVAEEWEAAGWQRERVRRDNGGECGRQAFAARLPDGVGHTQIRSGRPQTNGHVVRLHRTILVVCWRPAFARYLQVRFTGLRRVLSHYLHVYNFDRVHHGRITQGSRLVDLF